MKKQILSEQFRRMQKLAGIINESEFKVGDTIKIPFTLSTGDESEGEILAISTYLSNKKAIDKAIRDSGWEGGEKEELTWYKIKTPDGIEWIDSEELSVMGDEDDEDDDDDDY